MYDRIRFEILAPGRRARAKAYSEAAAIKTEELMDNHPLAFVALTCGTVHVVGHAIVGHILKP